MGGHGPRARAESKAAVRLIEKMLEAGFGKDMVIRVVNSLLQLRTLEEFFATVDLALINLSTGEIESIKIGAAPPVSKKKGERCEQNRRGIPASGHPFSSGS